MNNNSTLDLTDLLADNTPEGKEVDMEKSTLQKIVFKDKGISTRWEDIEYIQGYYSDTGSRTSSALSNTYKPISINTNIYATEEQCKAHLAQAQLSQIMKKVNGDWKPDWRSNNQDKWTIHLYKDVYSVKLLYNTPMFLTFKSEELAEQVLRENKDLLEQYKPLAG